MSAATQPSRPNKPWSIADLADYLNLSVRHVRRMASAGDIKTIRFGRRVLIPASEADRIAANGVGRRGRVV